MASVLAFSPMTTVDSMPGADAADSAAICPGCHTADPSLTMSAVIAGASWRCTQCAQRWSAARLAAVANYAAWVARAASASVSPASSIERAPATGVAL
jgi:hypothetical protein